MSSGRQEQVHDLLVVGAGPTGIAIGARARQAGLDVLLIDRGPLAAALVDFPIYMNFFTTRDLMEIAGVPMSTPNDKPTRREALAYYRAVAARFELPLALREEVSAVKRVDGLFEVSSAPTDGPGSAPRLRTARAVALAQGYFHRPRRLDVPGEGSSWVHARYREPYRHFGERIAIVGGGNSAAEAALDLWRNHARVTLVHRRAELKETVKYWVKPDLENRVSEGSIEMRADSTVREFSSKPDGSRWVLLETPAGPEQLAVDECYVLIGYEPDTDLARGCGVEFDSKTLVPRFDPETCESNVPGLYLAGTVQVGRDIGKLFIENSRVHADRLVEHVVAQRQGGGTPPPRSAID